MVQSAVIMMDGFVGWSIMDKLLERRDYSFALTVLSPLHIGSGEARFDLLPEIIEGGESRKVAVSAIQRDGSGMPWLPGSTLKGALRAAARSFDLIEEAALLGTVTDGNTGHIGALQVRSAPMDRAGDTRGLPFEKDGVYISSRTAIDAGRGISDRNKLFHAELLAPGAVFNVRFRLETRGGVEVLEQALFKLLAIFAASGGVSIGADQASGQGMVQLIGGVAITVFRADISGRVKAEQPQPHVITPAMPRTEATITLRCSGPYITRDPAWTKESRDNAQKLTNGFVPHMRPLRHHQTPLVTGQSVAGALRARLEWLTAAQHVIRGEQPPPKLEHVQSLAEAKALQPVQRLFGATGFRGVLRVSARGVHRGGTAHLTSARMDRFAGGTIDAALFGIEADTGVSFDLVLSLDGRATDEDKNALESLKSDIASNGLRLGHGTSRGFGWFKLEDRV